MTPTAHMSVGYPIGSKATTSGATNSGVPNRTCSFLIGSNLRASPKSMILITFPLFDKHRIFSGCKINTFDINFSYKLLYYQFRLFMMYNFFVALPLSPDE